MSHMKSLKSCVVQVVFRSGLAQRGLVAKCDSDDEDDDTEKAKPKKVQPPNGMPDAMYKKVRLLDQSFSFLFPVPHQLYQFFASRSFVRRGEVKHLLI